MKYLICGLCLLLVSCGTSVDFTEERIITRKTTTEKHSVYYIGETFSEWCNSIKADSKFADVGDKVIIIDGKFTVIKKVE